MLANNQGEHLEEFAGAQIFEIGGWGEETSAWPKREVPTDVEEWAWRVSSGGWEGENYQTWWEVFRQTVDGSRVRRLIIGNWLIEDDFELPASEYFGLLLRDRASFPRLEALFVGDIAPDEHEISWLKQGDVTPLFEAFPTLEVVGIRGSEELELRPLTHPALRELTFQTGGLQPAVVRALGESDLPALTDLELYLGTPRYFGGSTPEDLAGILSGARMPSLRYLGLRDAQNADEVAAAVAHAPIVAQLEVLDLSLGNMGDEGAAALLAGQPLDHLKKIDLHHHFISEPMRERLRLAWPGVEVDLGDYCTQWEWTGPDGTVMQVERFIAVDE
jgi:hypothetical protein